MPWPRSSLEGSVPWFPIFLMTRTEMTQSLRVTFLSMRTFSNFCFFFLSQEDLGPCTGPMADNQAGKFVAWAGPLKGSRPRTEPNTSSERHEFPQLLNEVWGYGGANLTGLL